MESLAECGGAMRDLDHELVARCRAGDLEAFGRIYARHERRVFCYAYHLLGHRDDADDVKQETFVKAFQAIRSFRSDASVQTWLLKICGNLCRDRIKSWERRKVEYQADYLPEIAPLQPGYGDPHDSLERSQTLGMIVRALDSLPPAQREIVILYDIEELSYAEIGIILGCTQTGAKLRLFRAHRALQRQANRVMNDTGSQPTDAGRKTELASGERQTTPNVKR